MLIVSAAEMREIDRITSSRYRVPSLTLMENAGTAVADYVLQQYPYFLTIGVVCGKGNNGGDGLVAARRLQAAGKQVSILLLADPRELKGDPAAMYTRLAKVQLQAVIARKKSDLKRALARQVYQSDLLVDALLGTGFQPPLKDLYAEAIRLLWKSERPVVAVDIPSGLVADEVSPKTAIHASAVATVSFTAAKPALAMSSEISAGAVVIAQIGSPREAITSKLKLSVTTAEEAAWTLRPRIPNSNKGSYGHVLVIGGSRGKAGAAAMAGLAALRAGAGLVTVAVPASALSTVAASAPELMTEPLEETPLGTISLKAIEQGTLERILLGKTVIALGPGISQHPETADFIRVLLSNCRLPLVLDADGLNAFRGIASKLDGRLLPQLVLTPHPGEMARLLGCTVEEVQSDRLAAARRFAQEHGSILVLKGHKTLTAIPDGRVWVNFTGGPAMAKGGSGDVLTGIIAAMLAQSHAQEGAGLDIALGGEQKHARALAHRRRGEKLSGSEAQWLARWMKKLGLVAQEFESLRRVLPVASGVYLHGLAGDLAAAALDESCVLATDIIRHLPQAFRTARESAGDHFVRIA